MFQCCNKKKWKYNAKNGIFLKMQGVSNKKLKVEC